MTGAPMPRGADAVLPAEWVDAEPRDGTPHGISALDRRLARQARRPARRGHRPRHDRARARARAAAAGSRRAQLDRPRRRARRPPAARAARHHRQRTAAGRHAAARATASPTPTGRCSPRWSSATAASSTSRASCPTTETPSSTRCSADADVRRSSSGGSSVGIEDLAPMLVAEHGELAIHGIAMRPSSPTGLGRLERPPGVPAAGQSGLVPVRVRLLRRPRDSRARRPRTGSGRIRSVRGRLRARSARRSAASTTPASRLDRRRGRAAGHRRRVDAVVDDPRRRLRHRRRRQRRLRRGRRGRRLALCADAGAVPPGRSTATKPSGAFAPRSTSRRAASNGAARRGARPRAGRRRRRRRSTCPSFDRSNVDGFAVVRRGHVRRVGGVAARRCGSAARRSHTGVVPPVDVDRRRGRRRSPPAAWCRAAPTPS